MKSIQVDLIIEILLLLPVKILLRLKLVCKSWHDIITSRVFEKLHHAKQVKLHMNYISLLLRHYTPLGGDVSLYGKTYFSYLSSTGGENLSSTRLQSFVDIDLDVWGSCHGLLMLCLVRRSDEVYIWNPATRGYKLIRHISGYQHVILGDEFVRHESRTLAWGFGYDERADDYKIICFKTIGLYVRYFLYDKTERTVLREEVPHVELYSLRGDTWKKLVYPQISPSEDKDFTYLEGFFYWKTDHSSILAFDFAGEAFEVLPLHSIAEGFTHCLARWKESMVDIVSLEDSHTLYDVYVYRPRLQTWEMLVRIEGLNGVERSLGFCLGDGILFRAEDGGRLVVYHPTTQELTNIGFNFHTTEVLEYVESLVDIHRNA